MKKDVKMPPIILHEGHKSRDELRIKLPKSNVAMLNWVRVRTRYRACDESSMLSDLYMSKCY